MLASDLNNTAFAGAQDPDSMLHVEFQMFEAIDKYASEVQSHQTGRKVVIKRPPEVYVLIQKPGDNTLTLHVPAREHHKQRFPKQWLLFQMNEGLIEETIVGWKIEDWDRLKDDPNLLRDLKYQRFHTVEQIAGATDHQTQRMGMIGPGLRNEARQALREKSNAQIQEIETKKDQEIKALQDQNTLLQSQMSKFQETLDKLTQQTGTDLTEKQPYTGKRRGRKPKVDG